jgi:hypothetical protein
MYAMMIISLFSVLSKQGFNMLGVIVIIEPNIWTMWTDLL